jgi:hypothetical protein
MKTYHDIKSAATIDAMIPYIETLLDIRFKRVKNKWSSNTQYNLNRIFKPRHVAVVGASEKAGTIGNALMRNLVDGGFSGTVLPVNPKYKPCTGRRASNRFPPGDGRGPGDYRHADS